MTVMDAFAQEAAATEGTIARVRDWDAPGLGQWSVAELVAHLVRAADRIAAYLDQPVPDGAGPACDRVAYFRFDHAAAAAGVADRSRQDAARLGPAALPEAFGAAWRTTAAAVADLPPDHLLDTFRGPMALEEYAATRVLELVVHHLDLARALAVRPATTDAALRITAGILEGLLEGDRPEGLDAPSFVLAATGRDPHPDPRFPVLS